MKPFSEDRLYDQEKNDPFFATGSSPTLGDGRFNSPLWNKEQLKVTFPVKNQVKMLTNTSSIYYYNIKEGQWNIPLNVSASMSPLSGPFDYEMFSFPTYWSNPSGTVSPYYTFGTLFTQDAIGFNAYGKPISNGSDSVYRQMSTGDNYAQKISILPSVRDVGTTRDFIETAKLRENYTNILTNDYTGSLQRSNRFSPRDEETFTLDVDLPFLVEKVVIEVPMCFGPGWFNDKTVTNALFFKTGSRYSGYPDPGVIRDFSSHHVFDRGGPALTVGLFCRKNFGVGTVMDLIASGTITHKHDSNLSVDVRKVEKTQTYHTTAGVGELVTVTACGLSGTSAIVYSGTISGHYTGSVRVKMTPGISNGIDLIYYRNAYWGPPTIGSIFSKYFSTLFSTSRNVNEDEIAVSAGGTRVAGGVQTIPADVDPIGRGMTGFSPSGGSIFGGEFSTGFGTIFSNTDIKSFYIENSDQRTETYNKILSYYSSYGDTETTYRITSLSFPSSKTSPYLLNPGDRLVLGITKTRPAISGVSFIIPNAASANTGRGYASDINYFTGTTGHDVQFNTGTISVTLYGSYVRENREYLP